MDVIKCTIKILNPGQIALDVCDQPIYALTKEIQWRFPDEFGCDKYFCLFGALHIEQSLLGIYGQMIKGTGLHEVLSTCNLSITAVDVSHIKRAQYCLQVSACVIYRLLVGHRNSCDCNETAIFDWLEKRIRESQMCFGSPG